LARQLSKYQIVAHFLQYGQLAAENQPIVVLDGEMDPSRVSDAAEEPDRQLLGVKA
jgi:hypothetical protein